MRISIFIFFSALFLVSCKTDVLPKPKAKLRLAYPEPVYYTVVSQCPYSIAISAQSNIVFESNCWSKINYPELDAVIHLTYRPIQGNLNSVLQELEKLTYEHTAKADAINAQPYENEATKVYGKIINVEGDVASNIQFHATDSVKSVLYGTLYFNVKPNYDSILPALSYIERDIRNLMESIEWKEE